MTTLGSRQTWSAALSEVRTVTRSRAVPSSSQMTKVRWTPSSSRASSAGPAPGAVSTATLVCARQTLTARRRSRLWATTIWASSQGIPARAKAVATDETAGTTSTSRPCSGARKVRTTPKKPGSPSASTTAVPRCWAMRRAARPTLPSRMCSACGGTSGRARWWAAPATRVAAPRAERAAAVNGEPSHPITVTRSAIVVSLLNFACYGTGQGNTGQNCGTLHSRGHAGRLARLRSAAHGVRRAGRDYPERSGPQRSGPGHRWPEPPGRAGRRAVHPAPAPAGAVMAPALSSTRDRRSRWRRPSGPVRRRGPRAAGSTRSGPYGCPPSRRPRCASGLSRRCAARPR